LLSALLSRIVRHMRHSAACCGRSYFDTGCKTAYRHSMLLAARLPASMFALLPYRTATAGKCAWRQAASAKSASCELSSCSPSGTSANMPGTSSRLGCWRIAVNGAIDNRGEQMRRGLGMNMSRAAGVWLIISDRGGGGVVAWLVKTGGRRKYGRSRGITVARWRIASRLGNNISSARESVSGRSRMA